MCGARRKKVIIIINKSLCRNILNTKILLVKRIRFRKKFAYISFAIPFSY